MPHSTTKTMRSKRPDTRPNGAQRRKIQKKLEAAKDIQDLRVTRKRKGETLERVAQILPLKKENSLGKEFKLIRALKKKLKSIDELIQMQKQGVQLDNQQLEKIEKLGEVMEELENALQSPSLDS